MKHHPRTRARVPAPRRPGPYRPWFETLESRRLPGDTLIGAALGLAWVGSGPTALDFDAGTPPAAALTDPISSTSALALAPLGTETAGSPTASSSLAVAADDAAALLNAANATATAAADAGMTDPAGLWLAPPGGGVAPARGAVGAGLPAALSTLDATPTGTGVATGASPAATIPQAPAAPVVPPVLAGASSSPANAPPTQAKLGQATLSFEPNVGQAAAPAQFVTRGAGYTVTLTPDEAVLAFPSPTVARPHSPVVPKAAAAGPEVHMQLIGADATALGAGQEVLPGKVNFYSGSDPSRWHSDVPTYRQVAYHGVYPGVDVIYYGNHGQLEYDFVVAPGADPAAIALSFTGAGQPAVDGGGDLVLHTAGGDLVEHAPSLYQDVGGVRQPVAGGFVVTGPDRVGFQVGAYDPGRPLVIDPVMLYSTYLSDGGMDQVMGVAVDGSNNAYVTGASAIPGFLPHALVAKLSPDGANVLYATYLNGENYDQGMGIAVDSGGGAYVTGFTYSYTFPVTRGVVQPYLAGSVNAFVAHLDSGGRLVYSTYLGGYGVDQGLGIAVDSMSNAYVTGSTNSGNFPLTLYAFQPSLGGLFATNAFVTKVNPSGTGLVYSSYLGGSSTDVGNAIAVNAFGEAFVTGSTLSGNLPTSPPSAPVPAFQATKPSGSGVSCAFVARVDPFGMSLMYSTFLGGVGADAGTGIAVNNAGNAFVTGYVSGAGFPTTSGSFQTSLAPNSQNAFVTKVTPGGDHLSYSTYLGGTTSGPGIPGTDTGTAIAVDRTTGNAYVAGMTSSTDFPTRAAIQSHLDRSASSNAFVTKLDSAGANLVYSTYLGGSGSAGASGIALDHPSNASSAYVTGTVTTVPGLPGFPTTAGSFQDTDPNPGQSEGFVTKIG